VFKNCREWPASCGRTALIKERDINYKDLYFIKTG
jgi:hypothetical protein